MSAKVRPIKAVLYGDTGVGKTCIVHRACYEIFDDSMIPTIGSATFNLEVKHGRVTTKINLWDTAGQEIFQSLTPIYFRGAQFVILVFDLTERRTFECLVESYNTVLQSAPQNVLFALVGNKLDLKSDPDFREQISMQEILDFQERIRAAFYIETSARTGQGVSELFYSVATADGMYWEHQDDEQGNSEATSQSCC